MPPFALFFYRSHTRLITGALTLTLACSGGDDGAATESSSTSASTSTSGASSTTGAASTSDTISTGDTASTSGASTTAADTSAAETTAATDDTTESGTTGPTSGPGVLPGESGLDAFCRRYVECGGTYYGDARVCIDESLNYWGECPSRRDALDAFGACMSEIECDDWSPDAYNPNSTPCAEQWGDLGASKPCD
jgi:hypothetical protein